MKKRLVCIAMVVCVAMGLISCGKQAEQETSFAITTENANEYIVNLADYENRNVSVEKQELTDSLVEYYADYYFKEMAKDVKGLKDSNGDVVPMTDEAIAMLNSDVFKTVSEFMVFVRNTVTDYIEYDCNNMIVQEVVSLVISESEFKEIPQALLDTEKTYIEAQFGETAASYGVELGTYLELCGTSVDELADEYAKQEILFYMIASEKGFKESEEATINSQVFDYIVSVTNAEVTVNN